jgi:hypothetical protein
MSFKIKKGKLTLSKVVKKIGIQAPKGTFPPIPKKWRPK